jgi:hypothetical protein
MTRSLARFSSFDALAHSAQKGSFKIKLAQKARVVNSSEALSVLWWLCRPISFDGCLASSWFVVLSQR